VSVSTQRYSERAAEAAALAIQRSGVVPGWAADHLADELAELTLDAAHDPALGLEASVCAGTYRREVIEEAAKWIDSECGLMNGRRFRREMGGES
jgi:hypothetical protein